MQIKIFTIPVMGGEALTEEMNAFLRAKKILKIEQHLVSESSEPLWCFCIRYIDREGPGAAREKVDYRKELDAESFTRFTALREIRRKIADEEGIRAFFVFTDGELAELAKQEVITAASMKKVKGIGDRKIEKYGPFFFPKTEADETSQQPDPKDS